MSAIDAAGEPIELRNQQGGPCASWPMPSPRPAPAGRRAYRFRPRMLEGRLVIEIVWLSVLRITTSRRPTFRGCNIPLCSGLQVCSPPGPLYRCIYFAGQPGFYVPAYCALLPPHTPDMLTVRIQAIDGAGTYTLPDFQPCRLLTSLRGHYPASSLLRSNPPLAGALVLSDAVKAAPFNHDVHHRGF
jgi:hypothetical protein